MNDRKDGLLTEGVSLSPFWPGSQPSHFRLFDSALESIAMILSCNCSVVLLLCGRLLSLMTGVVLKNIQLQ